MSDTTSGGNLDGVRNPIDRLAEEFVERLRRGEQPSLTEYADKHPELAGEIRDLFPALVMIEKAGGRERRSGPPAPSRGAE